MAPPKRRSRANRVSREEYFWTKQLKENDMAKSKDIRNIAIVGTGVIGASWAALYLARGFNVTATDPAPNAGANLRQYIDAAWKDLTTIGLSPNASRDNLKFTLDMKKALSDADFVQENGPERQDFKIKLFADMDAATPPDSIIASSSSGLTMSVMQSACKHPERCVIGHPFNPPHVIPLVEVVAGAKTSPATVDQAISFYQSIGKKPIRLRKEVVGHVANRLQAALYREVVYLIEQGVLDVADSDVAVCWGPGLRWGVMGPNLLFHLAGGQAGIQHFMEHLSGPVATWWKDLGKITEFSPEVKQTIMDGVLKEANGRSIEELERERDTMLLELLATRAKGEKAAQAAEPSVASGSKQARGA
jgi:3-hydroxyacyl-CoA dehydrogenase